MEGGASAEASRSTLRIALIAGVAVLLALQIFLVGLSDMLVERGDYRHAVQIWPGSSRAAAFRAEELLNKDRNAEQAIVFAGQALRNSGVDSQSLRTIAGAYRLAGNDAVADNAVVLASRMGWRDFFAINWLLDRAMTLRDWSTAARAADALLRTGRLEPKDLYAKLWSITATRGGQAAVAERLSAKPWWAEQFFQSLGQSRNVGTEALAGLLQALDEIGALPDGATLAPLFEAMIDRGEITEAVSVWRRLNPAAKGDPRLGIIDGDFSEVADLSKSTTPFEWSGKDSPNASIKIISREEFSNNPAVQIDVDRYLVTRPLTQLMALRPGSYSLAYDSRLLSGEPTAFRIAIYCRGVPKPVVEKLATSSDPVWKRRSLEFSVPAASCAGQRIAVVAGPAGNSGASAAFDAFAITRN